MTAFGYQSGYHTPHLDDDSYPASFHYDTQHNLIYFTGVTYSTYFDKSPDINLPNEILGAMGMSMTAPSETTGSAAAEEEYHLNSPSCFVGILKLPPQNSAWWDNNNNNNHNSPPLKSPKLIYAKRFGTPQNAEACSSLLSLPASAVNDALLQSSSQLKLVLLGHVNPVPLSEEELEQLSKDLESGGLQRQRRLLEEMMMNDRGGNVQERFISVEEPNNVQIQQQEQQQQQYERSLDHPPTKLNQGGFFTSISHNNSNGGGPLAHNGRSYGFLIDFDVSLTPNPEFQTTASPTINLDMNNAYGALLGGYVLESSPLVYPIDLTQNGRDPNQLYVVSMHSDVETEVYNPEYTTSAEEEVNVELYKRPDVTLGGAGGATASPSSSSGLNVGGVPKFGSDFYVKVEQVTITPYEELLNVKPTSTEHVKQTMKSGWGFGFKLNDATDVRPSCVEFVKGRTPDEDLLLMGGTTRKKLEDGSGAEEYDGFITKIIPPTPAPVVDMTTGSTVEEAESGNIHNEGAHPTKRIDSTTGRDETVTAICLPPPDAGGMGVTHAFVVGSATNPEGGRNAPSVAYLLKMRLDDMSTVWKEHVTSISFDGGVGGDVLGQGCVVSRDGKMVYLSGTIDGSSGMRTGASNANVKPVGGVSDVFVVSYDVEFGSVKWEQQLGTEYEDKLARGGGIKVDNDGNPIIMGSTRGALQRSRDSNGRMASNVFFMNLSRENGAYINAPFTTGNVESASVAGSAFGSGSTAGVVVGIVVAVVFALLVIVVRRRRRTVRKEVSRMWDRTNDDDFSYDGNPSLGDEDKTSSGALRIVRRGSDGWDDGSDRINRDKDKHSFWKRISGGSEKKINSQPPNSRKDSDDHVSFLAKLREEASSSSKKVSSMISSDATDPRLDGGASIKNMLSQYREVKKESIVSGDGNRHAIPGKKTPRKSKPGLPPPPPPRRKYDGEPDGLSEFTIV